MSSCCAGGPRCNSADLSARTGVAVSSTNAAHRVLSQCTRYAIQRPLATRKPTASTTNAVRPAAIDPALLAATSSAYSASWSCDGRQVAHSRTRA